MRHLRKISALLALLGGIFFFFIITLLVINVIITGNIEPDMPNWATLLMRIDGAVIVLSFLGMVVGFYKDIITEVKRIIKNA